MEYFFSWNDMLEAVLPWTEAHAEAPLVNEDPKNDEKTSEISKQDAEEEEEEEEEEELVDYQEKFEEECKNSKVCSPAKHHYDECVERVTSAKEGSQNEDCVEEFFHLIHCASTCAAPKLWSVLK